MEINVYIFIITFNENACLIFYYFGFMCWCLSQYYMSDDTVSVFEPPARNSGISSGRYLQRMEAPRVPGTKRPYRPSDCYMGQQLHLHERIFELIQADEWTLKYMEADPKQFPLANFNYVSSKVCTSSLWTLCKPQPLVCMCLLPFILKKNLKT
jgi:hypothetical protein